MWPVNVFFFRITISNQNSPYSLQPAKNITHMRAQWLAKCQGSDVSALQDVDYAHSHAPDVFVCSVSAEEEEMPLPVQVFNFQVN